MTTRLHVLVALTGGVKARTYAAITALHHESQKDTLYGGRARTYRKQDDDGVDLPDENEVIQLGAANVIAEYRRLLVERWDSEGTVVNGSTLAFADVVVDGVTLFERVPATYLIYLERELTDAYTFVSKIPTLDPGETWTWDPMRDCYVGLPHESTKTRKTVVAVVMYEATREHPAQIERVNADVIEGFWTTTKLSNALPIGRKRDLLLRIVRLRDAVKTAREHANEVDVIDFRPANALLAYVLAE